MSSLIQVNSLSKSFSSKDLFTEISFSLNEGSRTGLFGPNGSGKSTLLKILAEMEPPDRGLVTRRKNLRVGYAGQAPVFPPLPLEELLIAEAQTADPLAARTAARILLGKAQFTDFSQNAATLSGGWKKRLDIIRACMREPDILLLDEPTNHLDLEGILWLENFLKREAIPYLVISHDRYFLENICSSIIELNKCYPKGLFACEGAMSSFMEKREQFLAAQEKQERSLASSVRQEKEWLSRSPKARTTKSQSRIKEAYRLMDELSGIKKRNSKSSVEISFTGSERETRKLLAAKNLSKSLGDKQLFKGLDLTLSPGDRLGVVGKNGTGKTTLLKVLAKELPQDIGTLKYVDDLKIVYFDQHREQISGDLSLRRALAPAGDTVNYRGKEIHVNGWASRFLFNPTTLDLPIRCLSGGERARILIARLMLEPADILFLDEPTNDLDIPTLEVMEESFRQFPGAIVLITHDRCMMDRVCTRILGLGAEEERGYFADYQQWERAAHQPPVQKEEKEKAAKTPVKSASKKLSHKERQELNGMEEKILLLEEEIAAVEAHLYSSRQKQDKQQTAEHYRLLAEKQAKLEGFYNRWQELHDNI